MPNEDNARATHMEGGIIFTRGPAQFYCGSNGRLMVRNPLPLRDIPVNLRPVYRI